MKTMHTLFVYGALMRELSNHQVMADGGAYFVGEFRTVNKYRMSADYIPYVTDRYEDGPVLGELYAVDMPLLAKIDGLYGHPLNFTRRIAMVQSVKAPGFETTSFMHFCDIRSGIQRVPTGDFRYHLKANPGYFVSGVERKI